ncbi:DUF452 family protein [Pasteurellaceae bacterium HPA106]|uniref:DUF452 family protein n=1 Tax=Spirabiliibacterium pneumoniae TaxID=221400 RepID=UPI001AAD1E98|nr:pimeloyl-ACP methyl esterase BioG family protein [Spirabiliibacterium pneumoniae]MBE2895339.1 DUF452 family protein [Spirabiliibacterium pneumoniae]
MQFHWFKRAGKRKLILYFAGWSSAPNAVEHWVIPDDCDALACFDYRTLDFSPDLRAYDEITVVAWSLGVWVAQQVLGQGLPIVNSIAINGTGLPIDDDFGIPQAVFSATLQHLDAAGRVKFERRMCGTREILRVYQQFPARALAEIYDELAALERAINAAPKRTFRWHKAIIGIHDRIFPAESQVRYFTQFQPQCDIVMFEAPHFVFSHFSSWQALCQSR